MNNYSRSFLSVFFWYLAFIRGSQAVAVCETLLQGTVQATLDSQSSWVQPGREGGDQTAVFSAEYYKEIASRPQELVI